MEGGLVEGRGSVGVRGRRGRRKEFGEWWRGGSRESIDGGRKRDVWRIVYIEYLHNIKQNCIDIVC